MHFYFTQKVTICQYCYQLDSQMSWTPPSGVPQTGSDGVLIYLHHSFSNSLFDETRCFAPILNFPLVSSQEGITLRGSSFLQQREASHRALVKNLPVDAGDIRDTASIPRLTKPPGGGRGWQPTPVVLTGGSHGQRSTQYIETRN